MAPELRHLRHFVAVAEELNFTRAAGRLFLAQQALSSSIKQLEHELGQPLFVRDTRRVALTPAGETLLPRARRLLAMAEETVTAVQHGTPDRAVLRVDISSSNLETGALVLRRLREDRPEIEVRQREIGVPRGLMALREDELDVLLGDAAAAPAGVAVEPLRQEAVQVMLAADHPCAAQPAVPVAALADEVWLLPPDDAAPEWNQLVLRHCQEAGFRPRRYPGTTWGPAAAAELAVERRCVVPTNAWLTVPDGVVFRPLVDPEIRFPWSVMWAGEASEPVEALLTAARAVGRERGWSLPAAQPDRGDRGTQ
jgi:DNA-binding transcriptional LysR family regulator